MTGKPIKCVLTLLFRELPPAIRTAPLVGSWMEILIIGYCTLAARMARLLLPCVICLSGLPCPTAWPLRYSTMWVPAQRKCLIPLCQTKTDIPTNPGRLHWIPSLMVSIQPAGVCFNFLYAHPSADRESRFPWHQIPL